MVLTRISAEDVGFASLLEAKSHVLRELASNRNDDTTGVFELVDIHDPLIAELFEIKLVSSIEVGGVRLGVVILPRINQLLRVLK